MKDITLVVMAAGMGSRFGGLKQAESITPDGKAIIDFSVFDAKKAGFTKVVFIIREDMKEDFIRLVGSRIEKTIKTEYVMQDLSQLPKGRTKPFGTGHAILCCKDSVNEPFAIINADDYYGSNAFFEMAEHLKNAKKGEFAMTAYELSNTLSPNGTVSRGVCSVENGYLTDVTEVTKINSDMTCVIDGKDVALDAKTPVSMNLWGLTPDVFEQIEKDYQTFLKEADLSKDEFFIPTIINDMAKSGKATIKVYTNKDKWYGITYREDLPELKEAIGGYINAGLYEGI
ncbi:MAG: nucleotidyltransferase [Clostridia bacterium]|nr:nucleotidyltransferase [Clostridia bacterium]MBQ6937582.1 nucleotidyltransferase [Clostridia bacterium]